MMTAYRPLAALVTLAALATGCASAPYQDDRLLYGAVGGAAGAAIGSALGGGDAAILGGVIGAAAGVAVANREARHRYGDDGSAGHWRRGGYDDPAGPGYAAGGRRYSERPY